jgi:hypothetical protein
MEHIEQTRISASKIAESARLDFLPRHFGRHMLTVERAIYAHLGHLSPDYQGGYWDFFDLSNGGCYLAPSNPKGYRIIVDGNGFSGNLDAECAGIVATLFALSHLSMRFPSAESIAQHFHWLRDFACEHPDGNLLLAAID